MVKYTCKTPTARVNETTAVREALPKRMPEVACAGQSSGSRLSPRSCSMGFNSPYNVYRGFESRRASKDVSPVDRFVLRDAKTVREGPLSCARTFFQKAAIIRSRMGKPRFSVGAMQRRLCLRADTVFSGSAPKDSFPRRDGNTQALSRRFCRNDGKTKRLPYRRITYYEESYHQRKPKRLPLQKR